MNNYDIKTPHKYFAAANGYHGFRSYFDSIFASENFLKIYVLKGGPGTGKSSLLKRLSQHFSGMRVYNEAIYCSSDPSSLDGVIIERNARRIAVIDGTAPHERDAAIAGAIDEIINLGENWDSDMLEKERDEILELNKKKKLAYQNAYQNLRLAGEIDSKIEAEYFNILNSSGIQESANDFANKNITGIGCTGERIRLSSAFGKDGYTHLGDHENNAKRIFSVTGDGTSEFIYMKALYLSAATIGARMLVFPSPLRKDAIEEIFFPENALLVSTVAHSKDCFDTSMAPGGSHLLGDSHKYLKDVRARMLDYSRMFFAEASEYHFGLEKIYTQAMNFRNNECITSELISKIEKKLFK